MMFLLVRDLTLEGIPVLVSYRVLKFSRQAYYAWAKSPVSDRDWDDAHAINLVHDIHAADPAFGYRLIRDELQEAGLRASGNRVHRLCRENTVHSVIHKRRKGSGKKKDRRCTVIS